MAQILGNVAFLLSAVLLPWWVTVALGVFCLAEFRSYAVVIAGGLLMDFVFGIPEPRLFGFSFIYAALFVLLAFTTWFLNRAILE